MQQTRSQLIHFRTRDLRFVSDEVNTALNAVKTEKAFIIGGAELYEQALPSADRLYLTLVDAETEADVYFPPYEDRFIASEEHEGTGIPPHRFVTFTRK